MVITDHTYPFRQIDPDLYTISVPESWFICEKTTFNKIKSTLTQFPCAILRSENERIFNLDYVDGILGGFHPQMFREPISSSLSREWQELVNKTYQTRFVISTLGEQSYAVAKRHRDSIPPHTDGVEYNQSEKFISILQLCKPDNNQGKNYAVDMSYIAHLMAEQYEEEFDALSNLERTKFLIPSTGQTQKHPVFAFSKDGLLEVFYHDPSWIRIPTNDDLVLSGMNRIADLTRRDDLRIPISLESNSVAIIKNSHLHGRESFGAGEKLTVITQHLGLPTIRVFNNFNGQREEVEGIGSGIVPVSGSALERKYSNHLRGSQIVTPDSGIGLYSTQSCNL